MIKNKYFEVSNEERQLIRSPKNQAEENNKYMNDAKNISYRNRITRKTVNITYQNTERSIIWDDYHKMLDKEEITSIMKIKIIKMLSFH